MTRHRLRRDITRGMAPENSLFGEYTASPGTYDEMFAAPGVLRPHWEKVVQTLDTLGHQELSRRWQQARRMIHENGGDCSEDTG